MVTVEQVPVWLLSRGIAHVVASTRAKGKYPQNTMTLCRSWIWGGELSRKKPKRVCSKCRAALATANLAGREAPEAPHAAS